MKKISTLLLLFCLTILFNACSSETGGNSPENNNNSGNQTSKDVNNTTSEPAETVAVPLGTWMDFKTGEVMVFTKEMVYWAKRPGVKMTVLEIQSKSKQKMEVYFKNKPKTIYDMRYATADAEKMECYKKDTKLNNYVKVCMNQEPELAFEKMQEAIGFIDDVKMKYPRHNNLKTTDDPRMLMLYLHTPFKYWMTYFEKDGSYVFEGNFIKAYGAVKLKLRNGNSLVLVGGETWGDMKYHCYYASLSTDKDFLDAMDYYVEHNWSDLFCKNPDNSKIVGMQLDQQNGDLLVDLEITDVYDEFDKMWDFQSDEYEDAEIRGEGTYLVKKTIRVNGDPKVFEQKIVKEERIRIN